MIGTIRKHTGWLWAVIITVTIITFVFWGSQSGGSGGRSKTSNFGSIDGAPISQQDYVEAAREVYLHYLIQYGPSVDLKKMGVDEERETYYRLFLMRKIKQLGIGVDPKAVAQTAGDILRAFGRGQPVALSLFEQQVLLPRANADDFERYIRHELSIQQLVSVVGLGGTLVTPEEGRALYIRERQELAVSVAFFSASNYLAGVASPDMSALSQFYTNQMSAYRVPDRVQVAYVCFNVTNFVTAAQKIETNIMEKVESDLRSMGTNYLRFAKTQDEAKLQIQAEILRRTALNLAQKEAIDFDNILFSQTPAKPENLAALAAKSHLTVSTTLPFDEENGPREFDGGPNFARTSFRLTGEEPFAEPLVGPGGVYVIALQRRIPSEVPPLEMISRQVAQDYKNQQALIQARVSGMTFARSVTNGIAAGKTFAGLAAEARHPAQLLPPFSLSTRELPEVENRLGLSQLKQIVFSTPEGKTSDFTPTRDGGVVVFFQQRLPMDDAKIKAEMPAFMTSIRQTRQQLSANLWFQREATKSLSDTPIAKPKASALTSGSGKS